MLEDRMLAKHENADPVAAALFSLRKIAAAPGKLVTRFLVIDSGFLLVRDGPRFTAGKSPGQKAQGHSADSKSAVRAEASESSTISN